MRVYLLGETVTFFPNYRCTLSCIIIIFRFNASYSWIVSQTDNTLFYRSRLLAVRSVAPSSFQKILCNPTYLYHTFLCSSDVSLTQLKHPVNVTLLKVEPVVSTSLRIFSDKRKYEIVDDTPRDTAGKFTRKNKKKLFKEIYSLSGKEYRPVMLFNILNTAFLVTAAASVFQILGTIWTLQVTMSLIGEAVVRGLFLIVTLILCRTCKLFPTNVYISMNSGEVKISYLYLFAIKKHIVQNVSKIDFSYSTAHRCIVINLRNSLFDRFYMFYKRKPLKEMNETVRTIKRLQRI